MTGASMKDRLRASDHIRTNIRSSACIISRKQNQKPYRPKDGHILLFICDCDSRDNRMGGKISQAVMVFVRFQQPTISPMSASITDGGLRSHVPDGSLRVSSTFVSS